MPKCAECKETAKVGSRCIRCYVSRRARALGLLKFKYFQENRKDFVRALSGRYAAIEAGFEAPGYGRLYMLFLNRQARMHHTNKVHLKPINQIRSIIEGIDEAAKRASRSQEN